MRLKTAIHDPLFDYENFWYLPTSFIWETEKTLNEQEKAKANEQAIAIAKLADAVCMMGFVNYQSNASAFLPYPPEKEVKALTSGDENIKPSDQTLAILFDLLDKRMVPPVFVNQVQHLLPQWKEQLKKK